MAVSNTDQVNLAPSYQTIISQLQNRGNIEASALTPYDIGTSVVKRADQEITKARDFAQQQAAAGKVLVTPDKIQQLTDKLNAELPEGKKVKVSDYSSFANTWQMPDALQSKAEQDLFAASFKDPQKAMAAAIAPNTAATSILAKDKSQLKAGKDDNSSTGYSYFSIDPQTGEQKNSGVEAPAPGAGKTQGTWTKYTDDNGVVHQTNATTGEDRILTGPKNRPTDQLITKTEQLYPTEKKAIEKAKTVTATQAKPIVDSLTKADTLISDINDNNPNTLTNIRAELGQLAGIPGSRMGFQMMQQEGINPGLAARVEQALTRASGNKALSDDNKAAMLEYVNSRKQQKISQLNGVIEDQANGLSLPDVHSDLLKSELGKGYSRYLGSSDDKAATDYLTSNGKLVTPDTIKAAKSFLAGRK